MPFTLTVTNAGRAALVNAAKDGTNAVRIASVGVSAAATTPNASTAALPGEIKRISAISGDAVAPDTIHVTVRDESSGVYAVRSIALYLADGTLFAAYGQSDVLVEKSAQAMLLLALDVRFADVAATSLTFGATDFLNPPATTEVQGVVELATDAEASAGTDDRRAVTPKGLSFTLSARLAGWGSDIWRASNDGAGSGLDADLLDGQQGSYYTNILARLGYAPVNRAGDTMSGALTVAGSGLVSLAPNGDITASRGSGGTGALFLSRDGSRYLYNDGTNYIFASQQVYVMSNLVWNSGNDGAGSGLDADLLDGRDGSYYADVSGRLGYTPANRAGDTFTGLVSVQATGLNAGVRLLNPNSGRDYRVLHKEGGIFAITDETSASERFTIQANGVVLINTGLAWTSANDGAGSGLDADLLDGQDGSFYTNISARLGYVPANRAGDTLGRMTFAAGSTGGNGVGASSSGLGELEVRGNGVGAAMVTFHRPNSFAAYLGVDVDNQLKFGGWSLGATAYTIWHAGNDGAGSGTDADLLDGQHGSFYTDISARLGYWPVQQGTGFGQLPNTVRIGWSGSRVKVTIDSSDMGNVVFDNHIADVWRVSNDGAGSGLDADLLDGRQASDFALLNDGARFGSNGNGYWERRPNGVIEQWGTINGPFSEGQQFVTFPIPFSDANSINISATGVNSFANNRYDITIQRVSRSTDGCALMVQYTAASTSINQIDAIDWRAVGI